MLLIFGVAGNSNATLYEFNFDVLGAGATDEEIEVYMENTIPPPGNVEVNEGTTTNSGDYLGNDACLQSGSGGSTIEIQFTERSITEIWFDWEAQINGFFAYANGASDPFFSASLGGAYSGYGEGVHIEFVEPIQTLKFTNNFYLGLVKLDNLEIENEGPPGPSPAVPEPATMLLFGSGLIGLAVVGRKKMKRKLTVHG